MRGHSIKPVPNEWWYSRERNSGACRMVVYRRLRLLLIAGALTSVAGPLSAQPREVNVYTYREAKLIQPLFEAFSKESGIKVNMISAGFGLEQRIAAEGANT